MLRNRLLILLGGSFLAASVTWADGVAFVDCASHPEDTQVFGKPRRTPETVASVACGERFTILQSGFIFSRIQTKSGQVGYVYSNLISPDHSGAAVTQSAAAQPAATAPSAPAAIAKSAQPNPTVSAQPADTTIQTSATESRATPPSVPNTAAAVAQTNSSLQTQAQVTPVQAAPVQAPATPSGVQERPAVVTPSTSAVAEQPQPAAAQLAAPPTSASAASVAETPAASTMATPDATPAAQPAPAPEAEPAAPPIRSVSAKESWERPNPVARTVGVRNVGMPRLPLIELFGGYGYARLNNGAGTISNSNGVLGSFGWNIRPWLQLIADTSYNRVTVGGTKNVLYGNHWGVRYFHRLRHTWGAAPFVEGMIGGSRADTTVSGAGGYSASDIGLSYKVGGGVDMRPLKHFEIRVIDFDYYRTSFGTNLHQNNYFISTGIVMRLFGRSEE